MNLAALVSLCVNVIVIFALGALLYKSGYGRKIMVKFGLCEPVQKTDWAAFSWKSCLRNLEMDVDVVFFGDSITRGSSFQKRFKNIKICNLGMSGDTIGGMQTRVEMIGCVNPKKIFIMAGINELSHFYGDLERITAKYNVLLDSICSQCPEAVIYIESLLPINPDMYGNAISGKNIVRLNSLIEKMAEERGLEYINLYDLYAVDDKLPEELTVDGIHLRPEAYERWADAIAGYIN